MRLGALLATVILLATGCQAAGGSASSLPSSPPSIHTVNPSPTPPSSESLAPTPTQVPASPSPDPAAILPPNSKAVVAVDRLQLRESASVAARVLAAMPQGAVVYLYGPPFQREADGYVWRQALYAEGYEDWPNHREGAVAGWAAVGADGQQYLTPAPVECPSGDPTIATLVQMVDWERVACFGDRELTIRGVAVTGFGGYHPGVFEPYWLAGPFGFAGAIGNVEEFIFYHRPEGQTEYADGQRLRIIGHFMDGAAESCEMADGDPAVPEPRRLAILYCRERFVASSIEVIDG